MKASSVVLKPVTSLSLLLSLAACVTTDQAQTPLQQKAAEIVGSRCVTNTVADATVVVAHKRIRNQSAVVHSVKKGGGGWHAIDVSINGLRDNVYYNSFTGRVVCGSGNWQNRGGVFHDSGIEVSLEDLDGTAVRRASYNKLIETRPISVRWAGGAQLTTGTIDIRASGQGGLLTLIMPGTEGDCLGNYSFQTYPLNASARGNWSVACSGGVWAKGTINPLALTKGSTATAGTGRDSTGRDISFTIGGAN